MYREIKKGDFVYYDRKTNATYEGIDKLRNLVLEVEETDYHTGSTTRTLKFKGFREKHWAGWFERFETKPKFMSGDVVKYMGAGHKHLMNKELIVDQIKHFGLKEAFILSFKNEPNHYTEAVFEKINKVAPVLPDIKETLFELCASGEIEDTTTITYHIVNGNVKSDKNYTKNDLIKVLRILEEHKMEAEVYLNSKMNDAISVLFTGEEILDELGNNHTVSFPVCALIDLAEVFDVTVAVGDNTYIYEVGFGGVVYSTSEVSVPTVQKAN